MSEGSYIPLAVGEGYFSDWQSPISADDGKTWVWNHAQQKYVPQALSAGVTDHALLTHLDFANSGHTGFEQAGAGAAAVATHVGLADPHSQYLLASSYTAADVFAKVLTQDGSGSGLDADLLDGSDSSAFATSGHNHSGTYQPLDDELTAIAGLVSAANTVPSFTGPGTAALLTVGTAANNLVKLDASAKLPAVDGSQLTNLPSGGSPGGSTTQVQYNSSGAFAGDAGMTYDATNDALTVSGRVVTPIIRVVSDSAAALKIQNQGGTSDVLTVDTSGNTIITKHVKAAAANTYDVGASSVDYRNCYSRTLISGGNLAITAGGGGGQITFTANASTTVATWTSSLVKFSRNVDIGDVGNSCNLTMYGNVTVGDPAGAGRTHGFHGLTTFTPGVTASGAILTVKDNASHTSGNAQEWQTSAGAVNFAIGADGKLKTNQATANTNTPSGATAKQLPIYDQAGTLLGYIPVYGSAW